MGKRQIVFNGLMFLLIMVFSVSCVSVKNETFHLDAGQIPEGHAVLFVAINTPFPGNSSNYFQMELREDAIVFLHPEAINRIYVPVGWQSLVLKNVSQEESNQNTRYEFKNNEIHRFALIEIPVGNIDENTTDISYVYKLVPTTRQAFEQLGSEGKLPLVTNF